MAKVSGPLMSMTASGAFADTLVFANRKGQNVVRQLVIPANPMSLNQETARNRVRVAGADQHFENLTALKGEGRLITDKAALIAAAPAGQTWNGHLVDLMIGSAAITYLAGQAVYAALTAPEKAAWDAAAAALVPAVPAVAQKGAGGVPAANMTAGEVWFLCQYGLAAGGLATVPGAVPPVYA